MGKVIKPGATALFPVPAVLVSCGISKPNIITLAWVGTVCSDPPAVGIGVRPERFSHGLIVKAGEFVVNIPSASQVDVVDYCGQVSGRDVDKWRACGLTEAPGHKVCTPLIAECPIALECRVTHRVTPGVHDLFIGQVLGVQADEGVLDDLGRIDWSQVDLLAYAGGYYRQLGKPLGRFGDWRSGIG
jgi:flavin reductase (DIM6/NTAB) family NADH-FMN oxidoreductase RutF